MSGFRQTKYKPVNPEKYVGLYPIFCRSSWETTVARMLDMEPDIIHWASEPCKIPYINPFLNRHTVYVPDFFVVYDDKNGKRHSELWEVKPLKETTLTEKKSKKQKFATALNSEKWKAANKWAQTHGMKFRIITEFDIFRNPKRR